MKKRLIKKKKGAIIIEAVFVIMLLLPLIISLIVGSFSYYDALSSATDVNFEVGRFIAQYGCSYDEVNSLVEDTTIFNGFEVNIKGSQDVGWARISNGCNEEDEECKLKGEINITCQKKSTAKDCEDIDDKDSEEYKKCLKEGYLSSKHSEFYVDVAAYVNQRTIITLFPTVVHRTASYLQEVSGKLTSSGE